MKRTASVILQGCIRYASSILRRFPDQAPAPSRPQEIAPLRIFIVEIGRVDDAVGPKTAKIAAQFAPSGEDADRLVIADGDRPDRAFAVAALFVAIAQRDLPSLMDLRPRPRHVDPIRLLLQG